MPAPLKLFIRRRPGASAAWRCAVAGAWLALCTTAMAQAPAGYPNKPVRVLIPFAPGGSADIVGRLVGSALTAKWGQQMVIDNRGGAGGNLAAEAAAVAPPDGYTLFQFNVANAIAPAVYPKLNYDPLAFVPITQIASSPFMLVVNPGIKASNMKEFVALVKAHPGQLSYGSSGNGGSSHLLTELLKSTAGLFMVHIPYSSSPNLHADLIADRIQLTFATPASMMPYVKAGKLRALGLSSAKRSALLPDVPAIAETVPGFEGGTWFGMTAPAKTPDAIIARLNADTVEAVRKADIREKMQAQGMEPVGSSPQEFGRFIHTEVDKWARAAKISGAKVD